MKLFTIVSSDDDIHSASDKMAISENSLSLVGWYWIILVEWRLLPRVNQGIPINGDADGDMPFMGMGLWKWWLFSI